MNKRKNEKRLILVFENIIYFLAITSCPNIYLFHLFNTNEGQNLYFSNFLYLGMVLSALNIIIFIILRKLFGSKIALLLIPTIWILFWFINPLYNYFLSGIGAIFAKIEIFLILFIFLGLIAYLLFRFRKIEINKIIPNTTASVITFLFLFNFLPAIPFTGLFADKPYNGKAYDLKTEFVVDDTLPKPDIYWIHTDGMMGFEAIEKYCGDNQSELKDSLENRGFIINSSASLNAGYTALATPALLSPTFYDSYLVHKISELKGFNANSIKKDMNKHEKKDGFHLYDLYDKEELLKAFLQTGYRNYTYFNPLFGILPMDLYRNTVDNDLLIKFGRLHKAQLLADAFSSINSLLYKIFKTVSYEKIEGTEFPLYEETVKSIIPSVASDSGGRNFVRALSEALDINETVFAYMALDITHAPFMYDENGEINLIKLFDETGELKFIKLFSEEGSEEYYKEIYSSLDLYYKQHQYATMILDKSVDLIIEKNPDAIIIIQADHGIHVFDPDWMKEQGYTDEQMKEMWFSTMSAVRIPEKYGKLAEPLEPLNISRWLVNNFVGENYEYID